MPRDAKCTQRWCQIQIRVQNKMNIITNETSLLPSPKPYELIQIANTEQVQATLELVQRLNHHVTTKITSLAKHKRIVPQACLLIFSQSLSNILSSLSSKVIFNSCWTKTSITSHCHMPKLFIPSNFSTSNLALETVRTRFDLNPEQEWTQAQKVQTINL